MLTQPTLSPPVEELLVMVVKISGPIVHPDIGQKNLAQLIGQCYLSIQSSQLLQEGQISQVLIGISDNSQHADKNKLLIVKCGLPSSVTITQEQADDLKNKIIEAVKSAIFLKIPSKIEVIFWKPNVFGLAPL